MFKWKFFGTTKQVKIMIDALTLFENTQILKIQIIGLTVKNLSDQWYDHLSRVTSFEGLQTPYNFWLYICCWRMLETNLLVTNSGCWWQIELFWSPICSIRTLTTADIPSGKFLYNHLHLNAAIATSCYSWVMIFGPNWVNSTSL